MLHLCKFNLEFIDLGYKPSLKKGSSNYGFTTFELYQCKICGTLIFKNEEHFDYTFDYVFDKALSEAKLCGYKPLGKILESNSIKSNNAILRKQK